MLLTKDQANADIAIKNKLFVEGWGLFAFLEKQEMDGLKVLFEFIMKNSIH